ncbi:MAG: TolC family protein [Myxococcota bacterium]
MLSCPLWAGLVALVGAASAQGLTAEDAARSALTHDPVYLSAVAAAEEAQGQLRAATFLQSNPTISTEVSVVEPRWSASVQQPISLSGEGLARHDAALAVVQAAAFDRQRAALVVAAEARAAWADLAAAEARRSLATEALIQAHARRVAIEARVAAGDLPELDARLARLAEAEAALAVVEAQRAVTDARVALARFVPDAATVEVSGSPGDAAPDPLGASERADVLAAERRVDAANAGLRAERAATLPVVGVGASVEREGDTTFAGPTLQVTLPLWKANPDGRAAAHAAVSVARAEAAAAARLAEAERVTTRGAASNSRDARAGLAGDPVADALAALDAIDKAEAGGELDPGSATLLRQQVLDGAMSAISLEQAVVHAELDALLAASDPALLPPDLREASP